LEAEWAPRALRIGPAAVRQLGESTGREAGAASNTDGAFLCMWIKTTALRHLGLKTASIESWISVNRDHARMYCDRR
jgi:hypothetical protein